MIHRLHAARLIKRILPRSLLGRSLLMILLPLVLLQAVALADLLRQPSRRRVAPPDRQRGDRTGLHLELLNRHPDDQAWILQMAQREFDLVLRIEPGVVLPSTKWTNVIGPADDDLAAAIARNVRLPFTMDWQFEPHSVLIRAQLPNGVVNVVVPRKRLYATTIYLFLLWIVGTAALFFGIAALFMRNQVRAIRRLAARRRGLRHGPRHRRHQAGGRQ